MSQLDLTLKLNKDQFKKKLELEDGYTPIKGKDYFDGEDGKDGYTPIKGVDYFDGEKGEQGSPDTPEEIRDKLKSLESGDRLSYDDLDDLPNLDNLARFSDPDKSLNDLTDVAIDGATNNQVLKYNASTGIWEPAADAAGTSDNLDDAYNNFGATASKIEVDAAESQTGGLEWELSNSADFIVDRQSTASEFIVQKSGSTAFKVGEAGSVTVVSIPSSGKLAIGSSSASASLDIVNARNQYGIEMMQNGSQPGMYLDTGSQMTGTLIKSASGQWFNMNDGTDDFGIYNNAGTPEGVIAGDIGSLCIDTTNGALYIKTTDTANTGWNLLDTDGTAWGSITGTLSDQTDLQAALDAKEDNIATASANYVWHGDKSWSSVVEADMSLSDVTTLNSTTLQHGFAPKLSGSSSQFLNGNGNWTTPSGTANAYTSQAFSSQTSVNVAHNFGAYPIVQVLLSTSVGIPLTITHNTVNDFTVTFDSAESGTILATLGSPQLSNYTTTGINYTVLSDDYVVEATSGGITLTLPTAVGIQGKILVLKNSSSGTVTIDGDGTETIDGGLTADLETQYESITIISNGSNWVIV